MKNEDLQNWLHGWYQNCKETASDCAVQCTLKLKKECDEAYQIMCELIKSRSIVAAAPDLLKVLKEVAERMRRNGSGDVVFHSKILAAIRKVEGEE